MLGSHGSSSSSFLGFWFKLCQHSIPRSYHLRVAETFTEATRSYFSFTESVFLFFFFRCTVRCESPEMWSSSATALLLGVCMSGVSAIRYDAQFEGYNLNENQTATDPLDYWGEWEGHTYNPSPSNWRFPFYAVMPDRFIDGDPTNNEANGTVFEHHWMTMQYRYGGDVLGLKQNLDYLKSSGFKVREPRGTGSVSGQVD